METNMTIQQSYARNSEFCRELYRTLLLFYISVVEKQKKDECQDRQLFSAFCSFVKLFVSRVLNTQCIILLRSSRITPTPNIDEIDNRWY